MLFQKSQAYTKILIMGLGLHGGGAGSARFFAKWSKEVIVTDLKSKKELQLSLTKLKKNKNIRYILGRHRISDFLSADLIIQGAGIPDSSPYLVAARKKHIPIDSDIGIFFALCPAPIIGVTGSKGKSTTATLIANMLRRKYKKVFLGGNIRISVLDILPKITKNSFVVLELSSWQLEGLRRHKKSPHIAVLTNVLREHLNKYESFSHYAGAKSLIFKFQTKQDYLVANAGDRVVRNMIRKAPSKKILFQKSRTKVRNPHLRGEHNMFNIAAAEKIADIVGVPKQAQHDTLEKFSGLPGRLEYIKTIKGIAFYNDTTATMPDATIAALNTLADKRKKKILLIAGGADKKLKFGNLAEQIAEHVRFLVLFPGDATEKIRSALRRQKRNGMQEQILPYEAKNMQQAVRIAFQNAQRGDIILLSPGAASFGMFQNEFDRGEQFIKCIRAIT